jgi:hypothetical protein
MFGDSRTYLYRKGVMTQISKDHSVVQLLLDAGEISKAEADSHPLRGQLMRCIGMQGVARPDCYLVDLQEGDKMLLCSDGLTDMLTDESIKNVLKLPRTPKAICAKLIEKANEIGGVDNITAWSSTSPRSGRSLAPQPSRRRNSRRKGLRPASDGRNELLPASAEEFSFAAARSLLLPVRAPFRLLAKEPRILHLSLGRLICSLDPVLASDTTSQYMVGAFYDAPLQYDYVARPYRLEPALLEAMPEPLDGARSFKCVLKRGFSFKTPPASPGFQSPRGSSRPPTWPSPSCAWPTPV